MDIEDVVRRLTGEGVLITSDIMEKIKSGEFGPQTKQYEEGGRKKTSVKINKTENVNKISTTDFISYYNNMYNGLKKMLLNKMSAVSINKAKDGYSDVSVIGMVREKIPLGFVVEDPTGEIGVISKEEVKENDVIGLRGTIKEGCLFHPSIIWPGLPPETRKNRIPGMKILFSTKLSSDMKKILDDSTLIFIPNKIDGASEGAEGGRIITSLPNPCHATINRGGSEFRIIIYKPDKKMRPENMKTCLKKRHLSPGKKDITSIQTHHLIDPLPDVLWFLSEDRHVERYGGTTLIMSGGEDVVKYDAESGDVCFLKSSSPQESPMAPSQ